MPTMSLTYSCNYGATSSCGNPMNWCDCAGHGERPSRLARSKLDTLKGRPTRDHGLSKIGKIIVFFFAKFLVGSFSTVSKRNFVRKSEVQKMNMKFCRNFVRKPEFCRNFAGLCCLILPKFCSEVRSAENEDEKRK